MSVNKGELSDKTALVTGGGTGIGAACAGALAQAGCHVAIVGRRQEKLRETADRSAGSLPLLTFAIDVTDRPAVDAMVAAAIRQMGRIDILVHSAGVNVPRRRLAEITPQDWDLLMNVNATGAYNCIRAVLPDMRRRGDGLIINVSSVAGKRIGQVAGVAYNASKFAATALGLAVGIEEREAGIRVTNLYPGEVDTPILDQRPRPPTPQERAKVLRPEDVAAVVVMIASLPPRVHVPELVVKPLGQPYD